MSEQTTTTTKPAAPGDTYRFLSGPDMDPASIRTTYPGAQFVARAYLSGHPTPDEATAPTAPDDVTWGIVIRLAAAPGTTDAAPPQQVTTDDGRALTATLASDPAPPDAAATLAAAKYWELPPAYVARLARS